jgi:hypothetical protein
VFVRTSFAIIYAHGSISNIFDRFNFSKRELLFFKKAFDAQSSLFHESFRSKVFFEFASAVIEAEGKDCAAEERARPSQSSGDEKRSSSTPSKRRAIEYGENSDDVVTRHNGSEDEEEEDEGEKEDSEEEDEEEDGGFEFLHGLANEDIEENEEDELEAAMEAMIEIDKRRRKRLKSDQEGLVKGSMNDPGTAGFVDDFDESLL